MLKNIVKLRNKSTNAPGLGLPYVSNNLISLGDNENVNTYNNVVYNRQKYLSPSLRTFEAYETPFVIEKGDMHNIWDCLGNKYIDLVGQNISISVGHCHPIVVKRAYEQMTRLSHCSTMYYNEQSATFARKLVNLMPPHPSGDEWVVHFVNDGSEAVDLAVQMAREYTGNQDIYALYKAYHGLQGYAAGLTAIGKTTQNCYSSMFPSINHVESNNIEQLETSLKYRSSGSIGGIIIEPLQGYGGIHALKEGYMREAFELARKYNGVAIADEVQTGYGRCGETFWGFQMEHNNIVPDMVTIAKGMGNGVGIIGAVIVRRAIAEAFCKKMFFNTYGSNPVACAAGLGVLEVFEKENIQENCRKMGLLFTKRLNELCEKYPHVYKEIRGSGLFQGLEIYGKTPEKSIENAIKLHNRTLDHGIVIGRGSAEGNLFRIQPPMCITAEDVNRVVDILEEIIPDDF